MMESKQNTNLVPSLSATAWRAFKMSTTMGEASANTTLKTVTKRRDSIPPSFIFSVAKETSNEAWFFFKYTFSVLASRSSFGWRMRLWWPFSSRRAVGAEDDREEGDLDFLVILIDY